MRDVLGLLVGVLLAIPSASTPARAVSDSGAEAALAKLTAVPADAARLRRTVSVDREEGDEGFEWPPSVIYSIAPPHDDGSFLVATDRSLCARPVEREICEGFLAMIAGRRPQLGTDITKTRIEEGGYAT